MSTLSPKERDLVKCEDMRIHAERACKYLGSTSVEQLLVDDMLQAALIRCVEVVGEAARFVSESTRRRAPEIPWVQIVGMRHVLAHDYGAIDVAKVHHVVSHHLPSLLEEITLLIEVLESELGWSTDAS